MATIVTDTIGTGQDYSTPQLWEADTDNDLVFLDTRHIGEFAVDEDYTASLAIAGATTDADCYRELRAASGNEWDPLTESGPRIIASKAWNGLVGVSEHYVRLYGFAIQNTQDGTGGGCEALYVTYNNGLYDRLFLRQGSAGNSNGVRGQALFASGANSLFTNILVLPPQAGEAQTGARGIYVPGSSAKLYNCGVDCNGIYETGIAWNWSGTVSARIINCWSVDASSEDFQRLGDNSTPPSYCLASDASPTTYLFTDSYVSQTISGLFEDRANWDYRPKSTSNLYSTGEDLSATFTDDATGATRTLWSIGPYDAAASLPPPEDLVITPSPATATSSTAGPTVVHGSLTLAPAASTATTSTVDPTVIRGSIAITPAAATATSGTVTPTVVLGSVAVTPAAATATSSTVDPTVVRGSLSLTPAAASVAASTVAPVTVLGSLTLAPIAATASASVVAPTVVLGSLTLTATAATATSATASPTVVLGSITLGVTPAAATSSTVDPAVIRGSLSITLTPASASSSTVAPIVAISDLLAAPAPVTATSSTAGPTVVISDLLATPAPATATSSTAGPIVAVSDLVASPAAASTVSSTVDPTVILGSLTITPATATATSATVPPTIIAAGIVCQPANAAVASSTVGPTVVLGSVAVAPAAAAASSSTSGPIVATTGPTVSPAAAAAVSSTAGPTVVLGSITVSPAAAPATSSTIDPTVQVGVAPTILTTTIGTGGDYATFSLWEADTGYDLVSTNRIERGLLLDETHVETTVQTASGATTSATCYRELTAAPFAKYDPIAGTGARWHFDQADASNIQFVPAEDYFRLTDICIEKTEPQDVSSSGILIYPQAAGCRIERCAVVYDRSVLFDANQGHFDGAIYQSPTNEGLVVRNCVFRCKTGGLNAANDRQSAIRLGTNTLVENCTVYGFGHGIVGAATVTGCVVRNSIFVGSDNEDVTSDINDNAGVLFEHCIVSDTSLSAHSTCILSASATAVLNDPANFDYRPLLSGAAYDAGADLSVSFADDFTGETRALWSIGAYDFDPANTIAVAPAPATVTSGTVPPVVTVTAGTVEPDAASVVSSTAGPVVAISDLIATPDAADVASSTSGPVVVVSGVVVAPGPAVVVSGTAGPDVNAGELVVSPAPATVTSATAGPILAETWLILTPHPADVDSRTINPRIHLSGMVVVPAAAVVTSSTPPPIEVAGGIAIVRPVAAALTWTEGPIVRLGSTLVVPAAAAVQSETVGPRLASRFHTVRQGAWTNNALFQPGDQWYVTMSGSPVTDPRVVVTVKFAAPVEPTAPTE